MALVPFLVVAHAMTSAQTSARFVNRIAWAGRGVWVKADLHTHTRFSDGGATVDDLAVAAAKNGCDVVAITDHTDFELKAATPAYVEAIQAARVRTPAVTVITGVEWNVPPGKGQEHATVLFPTSMEDVETLSTFKERFDDWNKEGENPELARAALAWLAPADRGRVAPVVMFNHPSRVPNSTSSPRLTLDALKRAAPALVLGFEGAPGHQKGIPIGAYKGAVTPIDRWDPLVAEVGGVWDQWLAAGLDVWAAMANSDFHGDDGDFWPCEFAATWVYAPDRTVDGVIRGLRAGSFFAEHGRIVSALELQAAVTGLERPLIPGETALAAPGTRLTVRLQLTASEHDYRNRESRIDVVELIGISQGGARVLFSGAPESVRAFNVEVTVPAGGIVLRARGKHTLENEPSLMFYTNPIRIVTKRP